MEVVGEWYDMLEHCLDGWGQIVEAIDQYSKLLAIMRAQKEGFSAVQMSLITKIIICLELRSKVLHGQAVQREITVSEVRQLLPVLEPSYLQQKEENLLNEDGSVKFPVNMQLYETERSPTRGRGSIIGTREVPLQGGSLLPPPAPFKMPGGVAMSILIDKVGLKHAEEMFDPFLTIRVVDGKGRDIECPQDTPCARETKGNYCTYGVTVEIQRNLKELPPESAIIVECKHFKPKKKKISTKGWAFMEQDEFKAGPAVLEIYKKPTDAKRKPRSLGLLSVKPLYMHLEIILHLDYH